MTEKKEGFLGRRIGRFFLMILFWFIILLIFNVISLALFNQALYKFGLLIYLPIFFGSFFISKLLANKIIKMPESKVVPLTEEEEESMKKAQNKLRGN